MEDKRVQLAYNTKYICPHCFEDTRFAEKPILEEKKERVFTCPRCKTEYEFNNLCYPYDKLQQSIRASMYGADALAVAEGDAIDGVGQEDLINAMQLISSLLTLSYFLYKAPEEPIPEEGQ